MERKLINGELHEGETIEFICNIVRNAGIAYAQAEFCVFTENGSFRYNLAFNDFIREMDTYIKGLL